ncbi:probable ubiquitin-like-specific protease 2B [Diospyros lotus]|uniref:probable ubiquitin-like-specific protease 2B n=1 Tax=Diospyros lotus TaxID=55363 RepID=UPI00225417A3|nr:probable ubiquitin-like-specific protease 2B [Diospyros lotus]
MAKRKLERNSSVVCLSSIPIAEGYGDDITKHRSCWLHIAASLHACGKRVTRQEFEDVKRFERTSPCFLSNISCRKRSIRRVNCKKTEKLNSHTFECYLDHIWRKVSKDRAASFMHIESLWFSLYLKQSFKAKVLTWIKKQKIFSTKYVFIPIVIWHHWSLLILCHFDEGLQSETRTPCMLLLDSLQSVGPLRLEPSIRKLVLDIFRAEDRPESKKLISRIPLLVPKVPQQTDDKECGYFVLYFINLFLKEAPENFSTREGYPYFMKPDWFTHESLDRFCRQFHSRILNP